MIQYMTFECICISQLKSIVSVQCHTNIDMSSKALAVEIHMDSMNMNAEWALYIDRLHYIHISRI